MISVESSIEGEKKDEDKSEVTSEHMINYTVNNGSIPD